MRGAVVFAGIVAAVVALSQTVDDPAKVGEQVFGRSCANGYCHGLKGVAGGAPRLAARGFDQTYINNTVSRGVPGTSMPGFGTSLPRGDLNAVVAYVANLNGVTVTGGGTGAAGAPAALSGETAKGRDLFSDSLRGFGSCSTCHEVRGIGIAVATPIQNVPGDVQALRGLATPSVRTATLEGRAMPALSVSNGSRAILFYDLTTAPPVLHTAQPGTVTWKDGTEWRHSAVMSSYSDSELAAVLAYLREAVKP